MPKPKPEKNTTGKPRKVPDDVRDLEGGPKSVRYRSIAEVVREYPLPDEAEDTGQEHAGGYSRCEAAR